MSEVTSAFDSILFYSSEIIKIISKLFQSLDSPDDEVIIDEYENSQEMQPLSRTTPPPT